MYIIVLCIAYTLSDFIYCFNEQNTYTEYFWNWRILTSLCIWTLSVNPHRWPSVTGGARRLPSRCPRRPSSSRTHSACRHWGTRWYTCTHILLSIHIVWNENPSVSSVSLTREEHAPILHISVIMTNVRPSFTTCSLKTFGTYYNFSSVKGPCFVIGYYVKMITHVTAAVAGA